MEIVLRVLQVFLAIGLIGVVLLQRSEGGGLGIGSSGGAGSFMSVRGTANFLTRVTAILAALFMITCLILALLAKPATAPKSIFDGPAPGTTAPAPTPAPLIPPPSAPASEAPALPVPVPGEAPNTGVTTSPTSAPAPVLVPPPTATAPVAPAPQPAPSAEKAKPKKAPQTGSAHTPGQ